VHESGHPQQASLPAAKAERPFSRAKMAVFIAYSSHIRLQGHDEQEDGRTRALHISANNRLEAMTSQSESKEYEEHEWLTDAVTDNHREPSIF